MATLSSRATLFNLSLLALAVAILASNVPFELLRGVVFPRCEDFHVECTKWAELGECANNQDYMSYVCRKACRVCDTSVPTTVARDLNSPSPNTTYDVPLNEPSSSREDHAGQPGKFDEEDYDDDVDDYEADINEEEDYEEDTNVSSGDRANPDGSSGNLCVNFGKDCHSRAKRGECSTNPGWMVRNCRPACNACPECSDRDVNCKVWASKGECKRNPYYMLSSCPLSCGTCSTSKAEDGANTCKDKKPLEFCLESKLRGDCETNPGWMIVYCGKTCGKCDLVKAEKRCRPEAFNDPDYSTESAFKEPGDVTKLFKKVLAEYSQSEVVLQPDKGPWIIKLPNFVSEEEREALLRHTLPNVKRSTDQGEFNEEGIQEQVVSSGRTSSNAWCQHECMSDPLVQGLTDRISNLLNISSKNFESFQVLRYQVSQKYDVHHDSSEMDIDSMSGPRILTFFIYLSDVEEGGETYFNKLGIKVKPQRGMAVLWPSVLDSDPTRIDWRTTHAALPVIKGEKLAANIWIHLRDFVTPNLWGCTGAFDS